MKSYEEATGTQVSHKMHPLLLTYLLTISRYYITPCYYGTLLNNYDRKSSGNMSVKLERKYFKIPQILYENALIGGL